MFEKAAESIKRAIWKIAADYTHLNGKRNYDGSMGEVKITPKEFEEALFQAYLEGYSDR